MNSERVAQRAGAMLQRPGAWLEELGTGAYGVRQGEDRRHRPMLRLDEAAFRSLIQAPGLKPRTGGGWLAQREPIVRETPQPGRPGVIEGERLAPDESGRLVSRRVNLGESPIAWLARRRDAAGEPWLSAVQAAAGEKLREDFYLAGGLGRLTMAWNPAPNSAGARGPRLEPAERAKAAKDRVAAALTAAGPDLREILEKVCLSGSALDAAERALGLPRRSGKLLLRMALQKLAVHYGVA